MKQIILAMSCAAMMLALTGCNNSGASEQKKAVDASFRQEREFMDDAIRHRSPDVQRVDIVGNSVVYTHIYDGIVDIKTYVYDGDVCVEAERVYTFPTQMSALRHYRRAIEQAELYDDIQIFNNQVKYDLKSAQHKVETSGLTKEELKSKFDKQIQEAKADIAADKAKMKEHKCDKKHHDKK